MANREMSLRMTQQRTERAKQRLVYYFRLVAEKSGVRWDSDNDAEVSEIVDLILEAADYQAQAQ